MDENNGVERRVAMEARFVRLEDQVARLVSDAQSEKETRRRANARIEHRFDLVENRLSSIEHKLYWFTGAIASIVLITNWIFSR